MRQIPGGYMQFFDSKNLYNIWKCMGNLWNWIRENKYDSIECRKASMVGVMD